MAGYAAMLQDPDKLLEVEAMFEERAKKWEAGIGGLKDAGSFRAAEAKKSLTGQLAGVRSAYQGKQQAEAAARKAREQANYFLEREIQMIELNPDSAPAVASGGGSNFRIALEGYVVLPKDARKVDVDRIKRAIDRVVSYCDRNIKILEKRNDTRVIEEFRQAKTWFEEKKGKISQ